MNAAFAGALLRPHGTVLRAMLQRGSPVAQEVPEAAREAGRQLVHDGKMSEETLRIISRELLPRDLFVQICNQYVQAEMKRGLERGEVS